MNELVKVRLYGISRHNGSFGRVTSGLREGLGELGLLAGFVPVDDIDDDESYGGATAEVGLFTGPPSMVTAMASHGVHPHPYAILAPNSEWLPEQLIESMLEYCTIVAPSRWGASVVERHTGQWVEPLLHGVSRQFAPRPRGSCLVGEMAALYHQGSFRVLHLSSTDRQRKGTAELIEGWQQACGRSALGANPELHLIIDAPAGTFPAAAGDDTIKFPWRVLNAPAGGMAAIYQQYHLLCQPSRSEGFGLCPLEARASGVPVCVTLCTGHGSHMENGELGVVAIGHGPPGPIDDATHPNSVAPTVAPEEIAAALTECYRRWPALAQQAERAAPNVSAHWSWAKQTDNWLRKVQPTWI